MTSTNANANPNSNPNPNANPYATQSPQPTLLALRTAKRLIGCYLALSAATLVAVVLLRHHAGVVDDAVWTRTVIVAGSAVFTYRFAAVAARGSRGAYRRLRIVTAAMTVAVAVIVALPGLFPVWLRLEQAVCGMLLLAVVIDVNGRDVRALFRSA
ncbi:hypothetical protein AB0J38_30990 [Streptomyces sp. NPDC050095]|uniref:hypothetical protein n=1 Tax=unclassified Streptomyces TaxID=2593676 RepID=UPI00343A9542